ncbi:MAG: 50S ribosomal protein L30 [Bacteroidia bacterium]|nr:50S ribosomal protein L30 [Bacteroidia bacterium]
MSKVKITLIKSRIRKSKEVLANLDALGLKKINQSIIKELNPAIEGMIKRTKHLIKVENL